ncbi:hypothetical protein FNV43_RR24473 [Rhamnella rubrinervis]|uniref:Uncharacterized protein n=1 Tax=Rhamnella rubrinervis TaxID=2594499 RepID=A0A8K0DMU9_9ROSA|nr:hypothetical protein FNV43_RR24473 [Rhamnella rubrinervis]
MPQTRRKSSLPRPSLSSSHDFLVFLHYRDCARMISGLQLIPGLGYSRIALGFPLSTPTSQLSYLPPPSSSTSHGSLYPIDPVSYEFRLLIMLDEFEDDIDIAEPSESHDNGENVFTPTYSDALNEELKTTTLKKSFI